MKRIIILLTYLIISSLDIKSQVPCPNDNNFWLDLTPSGIGNTQTSFCTYAGDYDTFTSTAGFTYSFSVCPGSYNVGVTMYTNSGTLLFSQDNAGSGSCETWTWTATVSGTIRILVDRANCGTNSVCTSVSVTQTSGSGGGTGNQDCSTPTQICNDASFTGNSSGLGTQELNASNQGCLSVEHQSSWYIFQVSSSGTLALTITTTIDYDFAIWGPNVTCGTLGTPIRCSFAAGGGNTGLGNGALDNSESSFGDRWVQTLPVTTGQTYIMLVDNFTSNSTPFTLDWTMLGGASLNCAILPIEIISFDGYDRSSYNLLSWVSVSETNNDYYTLERSIDGINWDIISNIDGAGSSNTPILYEYKDYSKINSYNYYKLKQTDFNGVYKYFNIIVIDNSIDSNKKTLIRITNLMGQDVSSESDGVLIYTYSDGTHQRICKIR
jgi:hypothetical protein